MNLKSILKVKDSVSVGDPYDNGSVTGKVKEIYPDHLVIESQNEDGDVVDVQVAIEDSSDHNEEPDYATIAVTEVRPRNIEELSEDGGCTVIDVPEEVDESKFATEIHKYLSGLLAKELSFEHEDGKVTICVK